MRMKQVISVGALILGSSAAMAGLVQSVPVSVTLNADGSGLANGNMATARLPHGFRYGSRGANTMSAAKRGAIAPLRSA